MKAAVDSAQELFRESPLLGVLVAFLAAATWAVKVDALGFVSRRRRQRRADVFDTFEKLEAMGALTDKDRTSLQAELREVGDGLSRPGLPASHNAEDDDEPEVHLPPVARQTVQVADAVLSVFGTAMTVGVFGFFLFGGASLVWIAVNSKDLTMGVMGLFIGPWLLLSAAGMLVDPLRAFAARYPHRLGFVVEGLDWWERRAQPAKSFGESAFLVVAHLGLLGLGVFVSFQVASESGSMLGWVFAVLIGAVTMAGAVKMATKALAFLGVFEVEHPAEAEAVSELATSLTDSGSKSAKGG